MKKQTITTVTSTGDYTINWSDFANIVIEKLRMISKMHDVNLKVYLSGKEERMPVREKHLESILSELVNNAIKFSKPNTSVALYIHNSQEVLLLRVSDEGVGIPKDIIPHIFNKFYQYPMHEDKKPNGAGLGLSIVQKITAIYGGEIQVKSQPGLGTVVEIAFKNQRTENILQLQ